MFFVQNHVKELSSELSLSFQTHGIVSRLQNDLSNLSKSVLFGGSTWDTRQLSPLLENYRNHVEEKKQTFETKKDLTCFINLAFETSALLDIIENAVLLLYEKSQKDTLKKERIELVETAFSVAGLALKALQENLKNFPGLSVLSHWILQLWDKQRDDICKKFKEINPSTSINGDSDEKTPLIYREIGDNESTTCCLPMRKMFSRR